MALDLPPIQKYEGPQINIGEDIALGQQNALRQTQVEAEKNLPNAVAAYKSGDRGALMQIAQANPEMARSILSMEEQQQNTKFQNAQITNMQATQSREGALAQSELQSAALERQQRIMAIKQEMLDQETDLASAYTNAMKGVESVDQKKQIHEHYMDEAKRMGIQIPDELGGEWTPDHEKAIGHIADIGNTIRQQRLAATAQEAQAKSGMPMMGPPGAGGAAPSTQPPALPPMQGPTQSGAPVGAAPAAGKQGAVGPLTPEQQQIETVLGQAPPQYAATARAIIEGRQPGLSGFVMKTPYGQAVMNLVNTADPSFNQADATSRVKTRTDFTSGASADNIVALNTAMNHLTKYKAAMDALKNGDYPTYNKIANALGNALGNEKIQGNFKTADTESKAVAQELAKVFRKSGMSEKDVEEWRDSVATNQSPAQYQAVVKSAIDLMEGRMDALAEKYKNGMGQTKNGVDFLSPKAKEEYQSLVGHAPEGPAGGNVGAAPAMKGPAGGHLIGTSNGKGVYVMPDGSHVMEQ